MEEIKTLNEFIKYCFYNYDGRIHFCFNEMWEPEEDKKISKELLKKLKKLAGDL